MKKGKKALAIVSLVVFLGALVFVTYELFQVRTIHVSGCENREADEIIALSGLEYDTSIFLVDKQSVMAALAADPWLKPVDVQITYPDKITLTVKERHAQAYIEKQGAYVIIDGESWVLEVAAAPPKLPQVVGMPADTVAVGAQIGTEDTFKIAALENVLTALEEQQMTASVIDLSLAVDITVTLENGFKLEVGDDTGLSEKLALARAALKEVTARGKTSGTLVVSSEKKAYFRDK